MNRLIETAPIIILTIFVLGVICIIGWTFISEVTNDKKTSTDKGT